MPAPPTVPGDDFDVGDLPPLDGDERDEPARSPVGRPASDDDEVDSDASAADLDDSTGENDSPHPDDLEVDAGEGEWLEEPSDARDLDVGEIELDTAGAAQAAGGIESDEGEAPGEDATLGEGLDTGGLDSGEEGPDGADEELRDQDLPDLGEAEDDEAVEDLAGPELPAADEPGLGGALGWASKPWTRVGAPVPLVSAVAVACTVRGAFAAGVLDSHRQGRAVELLRVDLEGGCQAVDTQGVTGAIRGLAACGDLVALRTDMGDVFVSKGGGTFEPTGTLLQAAEIAAMSGLVWVRSETGRLLVATERGPFVDPSVGTVVGLADDGAGRVVALLADRGSHPAGVVRGLPDGSLKREVIDVGPDAAAYGQVLPGVFAACGARLAYATTTGLVFGSADQGWETHALGGPILAVAFVDGGEGVVAVVYSESDDTTGLVRVEAGGVPRVVALLGATQADIESDGRARALACDDARGVVWVVGGFGVAAFSTR